MVAIHLSDDTLSVRFTWRERLAGLLRDLDVPRTAVRRVEVVPDGLAAVRGLRAPGLGLPGLRMIGTWRRLSGKAAVVARRGRPALRVELTGHRYRQLLLDVPDPHAVAAALTGSRR